MLIKNKLIRLKPQVAVPSADNVSWSTYRSQVTKDGKTYDVQRLVAQPNTKNSNLKATGNRAIRSTYYWKAGGMNALKALAMGAAGEIPGSSIGLTVYLL
jgi:hypothetical protein